MSRVSNDVVLLCVSDSTKVCDLICKHLGIERTECKIGKFANGETHINPVESSLRDKKVYIVWTPGVNINDQWIECLLLAYTCTMASAQFVRLVVGGFPYARQDKKHIGRVPISAAVVAQSLKSENIKSILTLELHNDALQGFPRIPLDNLIPRTLCVQYIREILAPGVNIIDDLIIIAPDQGATDRARKIADMLSCGLVTIIKRRLEPNNPDAIVMEVNGDVEGKICVITDDIADTCGTLVRAADILSSEFQAKEVHAIVTHGIFSRDAVTKIEESTLVSVTSTNSCTPLNDLRRSTKIKRLDISGLLAQGIVEMENSGSISKLFKYTVDNIKEIIH